MRMKKADARKGTPKASRPHLPGYGMPTGTKGLLTWAWAEERLLTSHNYYLTTVRPDGTPHVMPLWAIWVDDRLYFSTGATSVKARNLAANAACVICTDNAAEAVVVEGTASPLDDGARLKVISPHYTRKYKSFTLDPKMGPIFEIRPKVVFGLSEKNFKAMTRWTFGE
jgi:nitroimidazol reductase NimA-like FMN-containing flavoprotein (pyridoxamine 5'-phosphate oxidase superfamily)